MNCTDCGEQSNFIIFKLPHPEFHDDTVVEQQCLKCVSSEISYYVRTGPWRFGDGR